MTRDFLAGLERAEQIAVEATDAFWNSEFARHGNKGIAGFKCKLGHLIEAAIRKERTAENE